MTTEIQIPATDRESAIQRVATFLLNCTPGKRLKVTIAQSKAQRSDEQNRALWGVAYPPLMEYMGYRGEEEREALHQFLCGEFWGWKEINILGKRKLVPRRTTTRNEAGERDVIPKLLFCDFFAFIQQRAAEQGVFIPDPDPEWFLKDERKAAVHDAVHDEGRKAA